MKFPNEILHGKTQCTLEVDTLGVTGGVCLTESFQQAQRCPSHKHAAQRPSRGSFRTQDDGLARIVLL